MTEPDPPSWSPPANDSEWTAPPAPHPAHLAPIHPPPLAPPHPLAVRRRWFWGALVAACAVFVGGATIAITSYVSSPNAAEVVRSYLRAVARGDATAALGYGDVPAGDHAYLTRDTLRAQLTVAAISAIATSDQSDGRVRVTYRLGGRPVTDTIPVLKRDGRWRLAASAIKTSVSLSVASRRASFAGAALPTGQPLLFPGALPVSFDTTALALVTDDAVVRFAGADIGGLTVVVSSAGQRAITAAVIAGLTTCVTATVPNAACPVPSGTGVRAVPASLTGKIVGTPTVQAAVAPQADGRLSISGTAQVDGSYQSLDFQNQPSATPGTVTVNFAAHSYATDPTKFAWDAR